MSQHRFNSSKRSSNKERSVWDVVDEVSLKIKENKNTIDITNWPPTKANTVLNVCPRGFNMVVERFGKLHEIHDSGLFFAIPFVDRIRSVIDTRELTLVIDPQSGVTSDNVDVCYSIIFCL